MKIEDIQSVRDFNRFYTNIIGLLDNHILDSSYSLPEARVLFELNRQSSCTAREILNVIKIDKSYLSRMLTQFESSGLIRKKTSAEDGRAVQLTLTPKGKKAAYELDTASILQIKNMLKPISDQAQQQLLLHLQKIKLILSNPLT
ncbi:MAG: MarR family transcriptional regulator [Bacteroidota bacterium]